MSGENKKQSLYSTSKIKAYIKTGWVLFQNEIVDKPKALLGLV